MPRISLQVPSRTRAVGPEGMMIVGQMCETFPLVFGWHTHSEFNRHS